jgi:type I restriction enzyme M protein
MSKQKVMLSTGAIYNLDRKNPNTQQDFEHLPPEQLIADIVEKDRRVAEIMAEIKAILKLTDGN